MNKYTTQDLPTFSCIEKYNGSKYYGYYLTIYNQSFFVI